MAYNGGLFDALDENSKRLRLTYNAQRQEDITEEIELILLSAGRLIEEYPGTTPAPR